MKPNCGQCTKKNRDCRWETQQTEFRVYRPDSNSPRILTHRSSHEMDIDEREDDDEEVALAPSRRANSRKTSVQAAESIQKSTQPAGKATAGLQQPTTSPFLSQLASPISTSSSGRVAMPPAFSSAMPDK